MTITVNFDPPLPSDNPATFNSKAFALLGDLNTWSSQANALAVEVNQDETALNTAVNSAQTSATTATTQAGIATTQAGNAASSAAAALTSANNAAASFDAFDDRYLGAKASDPTLDNDGNALLTGALYWNTSSSVMRVYSGTAWNDVAQGTSTPTQLFSGTGSQTAFTLSGTPGSLGSLEVFISGVRQVPTTNYTVSGTTLTFVTAPPTGTNNIFVRWISTQPINVPAEGSVTTSKLADDAVTPDKVAPGTYDIGISGNAATVTNGVYTTGNQTIAGTKTFSSAPVVPGLNGGQLAGMRNKIINGKMEIAQRGTSVSSGVSAFTYTLDRWAWFAVGAAVTVQRVAGTGSCAFDMLVTGAASNTANELWQRIESFNSADLKNKTVTLQVEVSSPTITSLAWEALTPNATDNWSGSTSVASGSLTVSSTPTIRTVSFNAGANTANGLGIKFNPSAMGAGVTLRITGVQLEVGSVATPFEHRPYGAELALCQRYFCKTFPLNTAPGQNAGVSGSLEVFCSVTGISQVAVWRYPVQMRATPTVTTFSPNAATANWSTNTDTPVANATQNSDAGVNIRAETNLTASRVYSIHATASSEL